MRELREPEAIIIAIVDDDPSVRRGVRGLVHVYAKADDDFKRDAAAKLEAFMASKISSESPSTTSTTSVN